MKTLYLVRHAKSDWKSAANSDFERPLNKRGLKAAPLMGARLKKQGCVPALLLSSPARRAQQTAKLLATALDYPQEDIEFVPAIYAAELALLIALIQKLPEPATTALLVGHNPGFSNLGQWLSLAAPDWLPTCGLLELRLDINRWFEIHEGCANLLHYGYPKRHVSKPYEHS